jgi:hypothetical protein
VNRRRSAVLAAALAAITLSSCATFNRNAVAAKVGDRSLSAVSAEGLVAATDQAPTGDQLRQQLTNWIRVSVLESSTGTAAPAGPPTADGLTARTKQVVGAIDGGRGKDLYDSGFKGSPFICLAAIPVLNLDDANKVLAALTSGTSLADAAKQFSTDPTLAQNGGVVTDENGNECLTASTVNTVITEALAKLPVGLPAAVDLGTLTAVVAIRPFNTLKPESQRLVAAQAIVATASVYVDPRYGRWDPSSASVVPLNS